MDVHGAMRVGETLAAHVDHTEGEPETYRVICHIGEKRAAAMSADGRDPDILQIQAPHEAGQVQDQIGLFVREQYEKHLNGPASFAWFVLRKEKLQKNIAVSHAITIGGATERAMNETSAQLALAEAIKMGPLVLNLLARQNTKLMDTVQQLTQFRLEAEVTIADMNARAEAGDDGARWEAMAEMVKDLSPLAKEAIGAWIQSQGHGSSKPASEWTTKDMTSAWNSAPDSVKEEFYKKLMDMAARQEAAQQEGGEDVES